MKNQSPTPSHELAIIQYNHQNILLPNIDNQPPKPDNTTRDNRQNIVCSNLLDEFQRHYDTQELLTIIFIRIMCVTSFTYIILGLQLLDKTGLSASISPILMSIFKYSLAIFSSVSVASVGDVYSHLFEAPKYTRTRSLGMCFVLALMNLLFPIAQIYKRIVYYMMDFTCTVIKGDFRSTGPGKHRRILNFSLYWLIQTIVFPIMVRVYISSDLLLLVSALTSTLWAAQSSLGHLTSFTPLLHCFLDERVQELLPLATTRVKSTLKKKKKIWKLVKYAIGLVGTLIFQNFFRLTTFGHVKAFMYLATSWLANMSLINATDDFGILNFLLGNMILGSTVSQYGLETETWFTYGVCLFISILWIKLKSMKTSETLERLPKPPFLFWIFYCCTVIDSLFNLFHQT